MSTGKVQELNSIEMSTKAVITTSLIPPKADTSYDVSTSYSIQPTPAAVTTTQASKSSNFVTIGMYGALLVPHTRA